MQGGMSCKISIPGFKSSRTEEPLPQITNPNKASAEMRKCHMQGTGQIQGDVATTSKKNNNCNIMLCDMCIVCMYIYHILYITCYMHTYIHIYIYYIYDTIHNSKRISK